MHHHPPELVHVCVQTYTGVGAFFFLGLSGCQGSLRTMYVLFHIVTSVDTSLDVLSLCLVVSSVLVFLWENVSQLSRKPSA